MTADRLAMMEEIKDRAGGMLGPEVYSAIYNAGRLTTGGTFLEVGTAHGAATIALALGAKASGVPFHIFTADPFHGPFSSRSRFGSVERNMEIVRSNYAAFGVLDCITVISGTSADLLSEVNPTDVALLLIDADGRIDRDLDLLYDRLRPDCTIILDDIDGDLKMSRPHGRLVLDQKHRIGSLLVHRFVECDLLRRSHSIGVTGFFKKGRASRERIAEIALPSYRELVFADIDGLSAVPAPIAEVKVWLNSTMPGLAKQYKRAKRRLRRS